MPVISTIYASQESVNDDYISLLSVFVKTGDFVTRDLLLAEYETSKAVMEIRAESDGYVTVFVQPVSEIKVGSKMFELSDASVVAEQSKNGIEVPLAASVQNSNNGPSINTRFSKAAENYLASNNINPDKFRGLSFVTTKDIITSKNGNDKPAQNNIQPVAPAIIKETNSSGKTIKPLAPGKKREFEYLQAVNSSSVVSRLSVFIKLKDKETIGFAQNYIGSTPLPTVVHEVSKLLIKYPNLNSFYLNGEQAFFNSINVGFALDDGINGLKVASIFEPNNLSLQQIEDAISQLSLKYSAKELKVEELTSSTFTITDLFNTGVFNFHPLVNSNNCGILGISGYNNGGFILDLSFDHRLTSGKEVSMFLGDLKFRLEQRFDGSHDSKNHTHADIQCFNCLRYVTDDLDGSIYFQKVFNTKHEAYICSNCLKGW